MYFVYIKVCIKFFYWNMFNIILIKYIVFVILVINYNFIFMFDMKIIVIDVLRYIMI